MGTDMASRSLDGPYRRPPQANPALVAALKTSLARDWATSARRWGAPGCKPDRWIERIDTIQEVSGEPRSDIIAEVRGEALAILERRARA
jgi:hypothetical protein